MSLIKWEPFEEFDRFFREMPLSQSLVRVPSMGFDLAADVYEDGDRVVAEMNLPGLRGEDIDIEVEDNRLRIGGAREEVDEKKIKNHYSKEIRRGSFERVIALPAHVEKTGVEATYENGVLKIVMPKQVQNVNQKIKVQVKGGTENKQIE